MIWLHRMRFFVLLSLVQASCAQIADIREPILDESLSNGAGCSNTPVEQISAGEGHTCARFPNGKLKCWGRDGDGQLGLGTAFNAEVGIYLPYVALEPDVVVSHVETGSNHTCAILQQGRLKCWGVNGSGQLGLGDKDNRGVYAEEMGANLLDVNVGSTQGVVKLALGWNHTCALLSDKTVKCWGSNTHGALGTSSPDDLGTKPANSGDNLPTVDLGMNAKVQDIAAGEEHTCALLEGGSVKCWGYNLSNQLGTAEPLMRGNQAGDMGESVPSVDLGSDFVAAEITAGSKFTCALSTDKRLKCWGENGYGQLGQGDTKIRGNVPAEMGDALLPIDLGDGKSPKSVSAGGQHLCVVLDDSSVRCWGRNVEGQLGLGDEMTQGDGAGEMGAYLKPVQIGAGSSAKSIECGDFHSCVLREDGNVKCWGSDLYNQLGYGGAPFNQMQMLSSRGDEPGEMGESLPTLSLCAH